MRGADGDVDWWVEDVEKAGRRATARERTRRVVVRAAGRIEGDRMDWSIFVGSLGEESGASAGENGAYASPRLKGSAAESDAKLKREQSSLLG